MNTHLLKIPTLLLSTLLLFACAVTPTSLQLTPSLNDKVVQNKTRSQHNWLIKSTDLRTARYLISISSGNDVAELINESTSTRVTIEKLLQHHWQQQGIQFNNDLDNPHQINVQLIKLLAEVEQGALSHETQINVIIKVQLQSSNKTYSKIFRSNYEKKSPLNAKVNTLATQLNTQLSQLLEQIVEDEELNNKLTDL